MTNCCVCEHEVKDGLDVGEQKKICLSCAEEIKEQLGEDDG